MKRTHLTDKARISLVSGPPKMTRQEWLGAGCQTIWTGSVFAYRKCCSHGGSLKHFGPRASTAADCTYPLNPPFTLGDVDRTGAADGPETLHRAAYRATRGQPQTLSVLTAATIRPYRAGYPSCPPRVEYQLTPAGAAGGHAEHHGRLGRTRPATHRPGADSSAQRLTRCTESMNTWSLRPW